MGNGSLGGSALSLFERVALAEQGVLRAVRPEGSSLLGRWEKLLGGEQGLRRRLAWAGFQKNFVDAALCAEPEILPGKEPQPIPARWEKVLTEVLKTRWETRLTSLATDRSLDQQDPSPFQTLLVPFVTAGRTLLDRALNSARSGENGSECALTVAASRDIERQLLRRLAVVAAPTLYHEFSNLRAKEPPLSSLFGVSDQTRSTQLFDTFVTATVSDFSALFDVYPVLGRLLATVVVQWVGAVSEIMQRLDADRAAVNELCHAHEGEGCDSVVSLQIGLSDPHHTGRTVALLRFKCGACIVYKPRQLLAEKAFYSVLRWFAEENPGWEFKLPRLETRETHGWMEYIDAAPLKTAAEAASYYRRCGALLCFLYIMGGSDCHAENLIASSQFPVLIDAECLLHPEIEVGASTDDPVGMLRDSVLRTGLLPRSEVYEGRAAGDISGLRGTADASSIPFPCFDSVNTDEMRVFRRIVTLAPAPNKPVLHGQTVRPDVCIEDLCHGFAYAYDFVASRRESLFLPQSVFEQLKAIPVRFTFRPTLVYGKLLDRSFHPENMRCGAVRSILFDTLARSFLRDERETPPQFWGMLKSELAALEQMDIPHYWVESNSTSVRAGSSTVEDCFSVSGYDRMQRRVGAMGPGDRELQLRLIRESLVCRAVCSDVTAANRLAGQVGDDEAEMTEAELRSAAENIAESLARHVVPVAPGEVTWIAVRYAADVERFEHQPIGLSLYEGVMGPALFLAAMSRETASREYGALAREAIGEIRRMLRSQKPGAVSPRLASSGAGTGVGGLVYGLTTLASILGDTGLLREAEIAASLITPGLISNEVGLDLLDGTAGDLLGLLALHVALKEMRMKPGIELETRLRACGDRLVKSLQESPFAGTRSWRTLDGRFLTGMAHGAAGISMALMRLFTTMPESRYLKAAQEGVGFESACFDPARNNWPDFRNTPGYQTRKYMTTWCHGAPGIVLARAATLDVFDNPEVRRDIEAGTKTILGLMHLGLDHVCCGAFGRALVLEEVGCRTGQPQLTHRAGRMIAAAVRRAGGSDFRLFAELPSQVFNPGFFQGISGIGYELLRFRRREYLPCVAVWA